MPRKSSQNEAPAESLEDLLGYQLRRASTATMASLARALSPLALSVVEASVLTMVERHPGVSQSEIGRRFDIHRANMAPLTAKLLAHRLVRKRSGEGRAQGLELSAQGKRVAERARRIMATHDRQLAAGLGERERARIAAWLREVWTHARTA